MRVITMIVIVSILLVISIIDFKIKIIPNQLNVLLFNFRNLEWFCFPGSYILKSAFWSVFG